jgi:uncharacterized RDD family membrane protein YckC
MNKIITIESENEVREYQLASFLERLQARLIDFIIIAVLSFLLVVIPAAIVKIVSDIEFSESQWDMLSLLIAWFYYGVLQSGKNQSTIGQRILRIKILRLNGSNVSFATASKRHFLNWLNILTIFIGYILFFFSNKKQCLHDLLSGCVVVKNTIDKGLNSNFENHPPSTNVKF